MRIFTQLMMRIKELYAIIMGSLTEASTGVFNGFSNTAYIRINKQLPDNSTELQIEIGMPSTIATSGTQSIINVGIFSLTMYQQTISLYSGSSDKTVIPSTDISGNSTYVIKAVRTAGSKTFQFSYSKDGGAFVNTANWTSNLSYTDYIRIGNSTASGRGWKGTINLNNTYIKIGDKFWYKGLYKEE